MKTFVDRLPDEEIQSIVEEYGNNKNNLIPILHEIQAKKKFISPEAQQIIADLLGIHPVEVFSVISFYHFLNNVPKGETIIRLCKSISCEMHNKEKIKSIIEAKLGVKAGDTTRDGKLTFEEINCFGLCDVGPALTINEQVFTKVTEEKVNQLLDNILEVEI